jgi:hypothetical protein
VGDAVVVVNSRSHDLLARNLAPITGDLEATVIVVDSWSFDEELAATEQLGGQHGWTVIGGPDRGFGAAANRGLERAVDPGSDAVTTPPTAAGAWCSAGAVCTAATWPGGSSGHRHTLVRSCCEMGADSV